MHVCVCVCVCVCMCVSERESFFASSHWGEGGGEIISYFDVVFKVTLMWCMYIGSLLFP